MCTKWQEQLGRCSVCKRGNYRHKRGCQNTGEDDQRLRLIQKHGIDLKEFNAFLRVMGRRYRRLNRVRLH